MNEQDFLEYKQAILNAQAALQSNNFADARQWSLIASKIAPEREEPWLLLAAVSTPTESIAHLQRALSINPQSEKATRGMKWALDRLAQTSMEEQKPKKSIEEDTQPIPIPSVRAPHVDVPEVLESKPPFIEESDVVDRLRQPQPVLPVPPDKKKTKSSPQKKKTSKRWILVLILFILLLIVAFTVWLALPGWIALARSSAAPIPGNMLVKPSLTFTATATATATATPTLTPTPTPTSTPTATATPTLVPSDTPYPTQPPTDIPEDPVAVVDTEGHWIDIDLSDQTLYAYDGEDLVASFLVSTGTYLHPTVTGQYSIYVKYLYTDMRGDGYYLPDVPYTMYFYDGYGIHGTYWHSNFGTPMSHGCVNMETGDAKWLFNWSSIGTLVNIHD